MFTVNSRCGQNVNSCSVKKRVEWKGSSQCHSYVTVTHVSIVRTITLATTKCVRIFGLKTDWHRPQHTRLGSFAFHGHYEVYRCAAKGGLHHGGFSFLIYWWLDAKFHLCLSKFLWFQSYHSETVWGHPIITLFRHSDAASIHPDVEAEHKQNWVWPWTIIQKLKLRLAQWWSPVSFTWDTWPSLAHLFLFITLF